MAVEHGRHIVKPIGHQHCCAGKRTSHDTRYPDAYDDSESSHASGLGMEDARCRDIGRRCNRRCELSYRRRSQDLAQAQAEHKLVNQVMQGLSFHFYSSLSNVRT